jgi:hypothetical protein
MAGSSTRTVAAIKLAELRRQRDRLNDHYAALERQAESSAGPVERLRVLYDGLRAARFAQKPLHPDVANLEGVFLQSETGLASPELVAGWLTLLGRELTRGRLRAEFAYVFGRLLDELANPPEGGAPPDEPLPEPGQEPWAVLWDEAPPAIDLSLLTGLFERNRRAFDKVRGALAEFGDGPALAPATAEEVKALLANLGRDIYRHPRLRRQATAALVSETQVTEYATALTILLINLDDWDWPAEGIELRPLWTRTKWRPYLDEDLVTILFLQLIGLRWGMKLKLAFLYGLARELFPRSDGYSDEAMIAGTQHKRADGLFLPMVPVSLSQWYQSGGYGGYARRGQGPTRDQPDALENLLSIVVAEVRFLRAWRPDDPVCVVQTDLRDFYLRIPHPVLLTLAEQLGMPGRWRAFFGRYLRVRVRGEAGPRVVRRGLLLDHLLGGVFADFLLLMMDLHVQQSADVRLFRVIDDAFAVTDSPETGARTWAAVESFCLACGLEPNPEKTGAVVVGGANPAPGLPEGLPRWGLLRLHDDGNWRLDDAAFDRFEGRVRGASLAVPGVLAMVGRYNDYVNYLLRNLGLRVPLGADHLAHVARRLGALHAALPEEVRRRARDRFLDARMKEQGLPEPLLYWPLTAGGLGLTNPLLSLQAFRKGFAAYAPPVPAESGPMRWSQFHAQLTATIRPLAPDATPGLEHLVKDFIERGGEVGGRKQPGLSPYWQWVVYTYGPPLLEALGTFRFLLTELVPLQLIFERRGEGMSLPEARPTPPPPDGEDVSF